MADVGAPGRTAVEIRVPRVMRWLWVIAAFLPGSVFCGLLLARSWDTITPAGVVVLTSLCLGGSGLAAWRASSLSVVADGDNLTVRNPLRTRRLPRRDIRHIATVPIVSLKSGGLRRQGFTRDVYVVMNDDETIRCWVLNAGVQQGRQGEYVDQLQRWLAHPFANHA